MTFLDWFKKRKRRKEMGQIIREKYDLEVKGPYSYIILKATQKLAAHLQRYDIRADIGDTPRQYFTRASALNGIDRVSLFEYLRILEEVMFSHHEIVNDHKDRAIKLLREVERSIEKSDGSVYRTELPFDHFVVLFPVEGGPRYDLEKYPQLEEVRADRKRMKDLIKKEYSSRPEGNAGPPEKERNDIRGLISSGSYSDLKDLQANYTKNDGVLINDLMATYVSEVFLRAVEVGLVPKNMTRDLIGRSLSIAGLLPLSENRDHMVPDDLKVALMASMPGFHMISSGDVKKLLDSAPSPFVIVNGVELDVLV